MRHRNIFPTLWLALLAMPFTAAADRVVRYEINVQRPAQIVEHFGASDAWTDEFIGHWPMKQQRQIADWLFSTAKDKYGRPKGIGLSIWRFNLGAGSREQGDKSGIRSFTRTECFLRPDGTYDFSKQAWQRLMLRLARKRGVEHFVAFMNSVPVQYTINGLATNTGRGGTINLRPDCYDSVARFVASAIEGVEKQDGIHFDYISPVNEPDGAWNWTGPKQEGSPATNREAARLVRSLSREFRQRHITTLITIPEAHDLRCLWGPHQAGWQRGNEIDAYFCPDSTDTYLGATPGVAPLFSAHGYWTNTPIDSLRSTRERTRRLLARYGKAFWMSELCMMSNDKEVMDDTLSTMVKGLYVDRIIHYDMVYGNATSWQWWKALRPADRADNAGAFILLRSSDGWKKGTVGATKLLWAVGNYSLFVRPGSQRYEVEVSDINGQIIPDGATDPRGVMLSAYRRPDGRWTAVAINYSDDSRPVCVSIPGKTTKWLLYRTSDLPYENLKPEGSTEGTAVLPPRSTTTFLEDK